MRTKNQISLLVVFCIIVLVGLISIQYYLIRNTYNLQRKEYFKEVKTTITPVAEADELEVLQDTLNEVIKNLIVLKLNDSISPSKFQQLLAIKTDSIRELGNKFIASQEKDYPILKELKLRYQFNQIIFRTDNLTDTILKLSQPPIVYLGESFNHGNSFNFTFGSYTTNREISKDDLHNEIARKYNFIVGYTIDVDINNWHETIIRRMAWMLFGAGFLLIAVIALFFWMYRSLIKQKKIAEIKTDFANNITHELKTPLTSLALVVKSLQNTEISEDKIKRDEMIQLIERQYRRMQSIIDQVMETSLKESNEKSPVLIKSFLNQIAEDFRSESHFLLTEIDGQEIRVNTDAAQLERVIQNLLENAQKYSPDKKEIILKSYASEREYFIEINDFGIGIPTQEQSKIFEKFHRVSKGNLHDVKGLGIGLYLSEKLIQNLGGTISVKSKPGEGSSFTIALPI